MPSSALLARGGGWIRETLNPAASGKILQEGCKGEREEEKEREPAGNANYFTRARRKSKIRSESSARGRYYAAEQDEEEAVRGREGGEELQFCVDISHGRRVSKRNIWFPRVRSSVEPVFRLCLTVALLDRYHHPSPPPLPPRIPAGGKIRGRRNVTPFSMSRRRYSYR